ncbi:hypothetical protein Zmor_006176 [Zophobas morio]|uniref:Uncharacterized protein n=1 Tax=Zophobas morio TaxID=2755281 RepID=A0AA38MNB3_9CUCU|nr:hypothetical protein Zmor_006176 [Zophobas morio]
MNGQATWIKNQKSNFIRHFFNRNVKTRKGPVIIERSLKSVYGPVFQCRVCRYGNLCARTFASVVQHLRDHGTCNLKLTIVVVMGQKEEIGFTQLVVHPTLKEHGHIHTMLTKCTVWSPLIVHVV